MIKTLLWGMTKEYEPLVKYLREDNVCDVVVWMGAGENCTHRRKEYFTMRFDKTVPVLCDDATYQKVFANYYVYLDRCNTFNRSNTHTIFEYLNLFNRQLNYFYDLLRTHQIELVILNRPPHTGPDTLLYELAKAMGLKTIILFPSFFDNRFFYCWDMADFGSFNDIPEAFPHPGITIERKHEKYIPYHQKIPQYRYGLWQAIQDFKKGNLNAFTRLKNYQAFAKRLETLTCRNLDLRQPYVYFPLHLQPELSTSTLGRVYYCDQALAIERLSHKLPPGWKIILKEHLLQTEYMRDESFFDRLEALGNVVFAPIETSTYTLTEQCQLVATIAGTVGWEAITGGKNVVLFGQTWYQTLPGVFVYDEHLDIEQVRAYQIDHRHLETSLQHLLSKCGEGVLSNEYYDLKNFDPEANGKSLALFFKKILSDVAISHPVTV